MVRKFGKFLRKSKEKKFSKSSKKVDNNTLRKHVLNVVRKALLNLSVRSKLGNMLVKRKGRRIENKKKAYIPWEDNASTTSNSSSDEEIANACLTTKSMNYLSTSEKTKVNPDSKELLEAFNEMHEEAQRLVVLNKKMKRKLKMHITKLALTQDKLNKLKQENKNLVSRCEATAWDDTSTSFNIDDYKFLQTKFENFKKDHHVECMKLQTTFSYLKDLFGKLNKGKSDLNHMPSRQKHTLDKTGLGYNK